MCSTVYYFRWYGLENQRSEAYLKAANKGSFPYRLESHALVERSLLCQEALRLLPAKRVVCLADYAGKSVLAKIFFGSGYKRRWKREIEGVGYISDSGVRTAKVLESVLDESEGIAIILFGFIEQAETLERRWQRASSDEVKRKILQSVLAVIATLHNHGTVQKDIHLNNFLLSKEQIYLIDGDQVSLEEGGRNLAAEGSIDNLALFFAQFYPQEDRWIEGALDDYLIHRKGSVVEMGLAAFKARVNVLRAWRERRYIEKKIFRVCSEFNVIKSRNSFAVFSRQFKEEEVRQFIKNPDQFIEQGEILKSGRTATVAKISFMGKAYIIKRYNKKSTVHRLARSFKESRAAVSWRNGHFLRFNGIPTAAPLLMLEQRVAGLRFGSYIVTEYISGEHAFDYFSEDDHSSTAQQMAGELANLVRILHSCGFSHGDLKAHNIWIAGGHPLLIDLDGMRKNRSSKQQERFANKDWSRLFRDLGQRGVADVLFRSVDLEALALK